MNSEALNRDRPLPPEIVETCVNQLETVLERYAWAIVRDWALAKDATQNAFVSLARFGGDVSEEARKSWLFKVVHREALKLRDSRQIHPTLPIVAEPASHYDSTPLHALIEQERIEILREQIAQLPMEQQTILRMRFMDGKSFSQIAASLNIPLGTALSRMRIALDKLRRQNDDPSH